MTENNKRELLQQLERCKDNLDITMNGDSQYWKIMERKEGGF